MMVVCRLACIVPMRRALGAEPARVLADDASSGGEGSQCGI
jgi:hypothetical protein